MDGLGGKWTVQNDIKWTVYESGRSEKRKWTVHKKMKPQKCVGIKKHESGRSQIAWAIIKG